MVVGIVDTAATIATAVVEDTATTVGASDADIDEKERCRNGSLLAGQKPSAAQALHHALSRAEWRPRREGRPA